jgi:hypothetical protein
MKDLVTCLRRDEQNILPLRPSAHERFSDDPLGDGEARFRSPTQRYAIRDRGKAAEIQGIAQEQAYWMRVLRQKDDLALLQQLILARLATPYPDGTPAAGSQ